MQGDLHDPEEQQAARQETAKDQDQRDLSEHIRVIAPKCREQSTQASAQVAAPPVLSHSPTLPQQESPDRA